MADTIERRIGDLTVKIDRRLCVGFADCIDVAPEAFALDGEGVVAFTEALELSPRERLLQACEACPVDALTVLDVDGRQLVPEAGG